MPEHVVEKKGPGDFGRGKSILFFTNMPRTEDMPASRQQEDWLSEISKHVPVVGTHELDLPERISRGLSPWELEDFFEEETYRDLGWLKDAAMRHGNTVFVKKRLEKIMRAIFSAMGCELPIEVDDFLAEGGKFVTFRDKIGKTHIVAGKTLPRAKKARLSKIYGSENVHYVSHVPEILLEPKEEPSHLDMDFSFVPKRVQVGGKNYEGVLLVSKRMRWSEEMKKLAREHGYYVCVVPNRVPNCIYLEDEGQSHLFVDEHLDELSHLNKDLDGKTVSELLASAEGLNLVKMPVFYRGAGGSIRCSFLVVPKAPKQPEDSSQEEYLAKPPVFRIRNLSP